MVSSRARAARGFRAGARARRRGIEVSGRKGVAGADERRFSTPELLLFEKRMLHPAERRDLAPRGAASSATTDAALTSRPELSDERAARVRRLRADGDPFSVVVGKAGTGKTIALDVARQAWQHDGHRVIGAALARRAAADWWTRRGRDEPGVMLALRRADVADLNQRAMNSNHCATSSTPARPARARSNA